MKTILKQLTADAVLYTLFYLAVFKEVNGADNLLIAYIWVALIISVLTPFIIKEMKLEPAMELLEKKKTMGTYYAITSIFEIGVFAWFGWWWCFAAWIVIALMSYSAKQWVEERIEVLTEN